MKITFKMVKDSRSTSTGFDTSGAAASFGPDLRSVFGFKGGSGDLGKDIRGASTDFPTVTLRSDAQVANVALEFLKVIVNPKVNTFMADAVIEAKRVAESYIDNFFNWVGHNFMGTEYAAWNLGVTWAELNDDYVAMKGHSGYWLYTGRLRRQFYAKKGLKTFGPVEVLPVRAESVNLRNRKTMGQAVRIRLFPKLDALFGSDVSSVAGHRIDQALLDIGGITEEMFRKLEGRHEYYRPLLGPALAKYANTIIPNAIRKALIRKGYSNDTRLVSGINDAP
jgi:hypothetical protein